VGVTVLVRRCAWCNRVFGRDGWHTPVEQPQPDHETATICPDCVAAYTAQAEAELGA
jgi:hypothetical protein